MNNPSIQDFFDFPPCLPSRFVSHAFLFETKSFLPPLKALNCGCMPPLLRTSSEPLYLSLASPLFSFVFFNGGLDKKLPPNRRVALATLQSEWFPCPLALGSRGSENISPHLGLSLPALPRQLPPFSPAPSISTLQRIQALFSGGQESHDGHCRNFPFSAPTLKALGSQIE